MPFVGLGSALHPDKAAGACQSKGCTERVAFLFSWPGRELAVACWPCTERLMKIAEAMGFELRPTCTAYGAELLNEIGAAVLAQGRLEREAEAGE